MILNRLAFYIFIEGKNMTHNPKDTDQIQDMGALLDSVESLKPLERGQIIEGVIMRKDHDGILINVGHKSEGLVPTHEMSTVKSENLESYEIGDPVLVYVLRDGNSGGAPLFSIDKAAGETGWATLSKALDKGTPLEGKILGFNRGGAMVDVEAVQGFVPVSQIASISRNELEDILSSLAPKEQGEPRESNSAIKNADQGNTQKKYTGSKLKLKVLEIDRSRNRAILSERLAVKEERDSKKLSIIENLAVGEKRTGKVSGISNFGVFVDIGGADGLIHVSELSWAPVQSPEEIVTVGQEIEVEILTLDLETKKIGLTLKRMTPEPWQQIHETLHIGDVVDATITKLTDFGAFARVNNAIEGLVHITELSSSAIRHPGDVVKEGDAVRLKVLRIEQDRKRLALSLIQAIEETY